MNALMWMVAGTLLAVPPGTARPVPLRLEKGQEFCYQSSFTREGERAGARLEIALESHVLILDVTPQGARAAFITVQRLEGNAAVPVARLETGRIDPSGRVTLDAGGAPRLPIDGPPTLETLPFLELPRELPDAGQPFQIVDPESGPQLWKPLMIEFRERGRCLKLSGTQSSGDWNQAGRLAWRREETAWLLLSEGYVDHAERRTEWRTPGGDTYRTVTVIDLFAPPAPVPLAQFQNRTKEINEAVRFSRRLAELMKPRGEPDYRGYDELLRAIDHHDDRSTPYGVAIRSLRRQVEQARAGERPPQPIVIHSTSSAAAGESADVGQAAPELSLRDVETGERSSLRSLRGKPVVLLFFKPESKLTGALMAYVRAATHSYGDRVHVIPLAVDGDDAQLQRLRSASGLSGPIRECRAALRQFAGNSTPRVVLLDRSGIIRVIAPGWGGEYPDWLHKELQQIVLEK